VRESAATAERGPVTRLKGPNSARMSFVTTKRPGRPSRINPLPALSDAVSGRKRPSTCSRPRGTRIAASGLAGPCNPDVTDPLCFHRTRTAKVPLASGSAVSVWPYDFRKCVAGCGIEVFPPGRIPSSKKNEIAAVSAYSSRDAGGDWCPARKKTSGHLSLRRQPSRAWCAVRMQQVELVPRYRETDDLEAEVNTQTRLWSRHSELFDSSHFQTASTAASCAVEQFNSAEPGFFRRPVVSRSGSVTGRVQGPARHWRLSSLPAWSRAS